MGTECQRPGKRNRNVSFLQAALNFCYVTIRRLNGGLGSPSSSIYLFSPSFQLQSQPFCEGKTAINNKNGQEGSF